MGIGTDTKYKGNFELHPNVMLNHLSKLPLVVSCRCNRCNQTNENSKSHWMSHLKYDAGTSDTHVALLRSVYVHSGKSSEHCRQQIDDDLLRLALSFLYRYASAINPTSRDPLG